MTGPGENSHSIDAASKLNPAQQQVLDELGSTERPQFRDDLRDHLRHELESSLGKILDTAIQNDTGTIFVSKRKLSLIHGCETRFVADENSDFNWSIPAARGTVAHKAIELLIGRRGKPTPLDLVHDAMDRLEADQRSIGTFIQELSEAERAELVGRASDFVTTFTETFPPIKRKWVPVSESRVRADLCDDRVTLQGTVDLSLGRARGNEAGKVLIDLKTGKPQPDHISDLRFYALLETLKLGVPPRLLVNYYLDAGQPRQEAVTEDLIWSTAKRVVDGAAKQVELATQSRPPTLNPGSACRFCPVLEECDEGSAHMESLTANDPLTKPLSPID